jgi:thioredoxin
MTRSIIACRNCGAKNRIDEDRARVEKPVCGRCHAPLEIFSGAAGYSGTPMCLTDQTFESELAAAGDRPVLVDCWAAWCGPCRMLAPTIDQLAAESGGRFVIAKLNIDENPRTAEKFRISSIPAMLVFKRGQLVDQIVGLQPKTAIAARLERQL